MKELWNKVKALWASFRAWKYSNIALWSAAGVAVAAVAVVIVLCAVGPKGNDSPTLPTGGASMDGTNPTGGENNNNENTGATQGTEGTEATQAPEDSSGETQPSGATQPTQPSGSTNPTQPTQPTQPTTPNVPTTNPSVPANKTNPPASLILNADGSYGGTLNKTLYGEGAPKNGQFDVAKSAYYTVNNDYYNMSSTTERIIFPKFKSYQQTMQDTSGLACVLMILNYMGKDTQNTYTELELVKKYEALNNTTVFGKGTTEEGLVKLVNELGVGFTATNTDAFKFSGSAVADRMKTIKKFFTDSIKDGKFVLVRYQSPTGNGWKLVAGYDNLGNIQNTKTEAFSDHYGDDVIIFAEPFDGGDHCQDGFATERAQDFYIWWREMAIDGTVDENSKWSYVVIDPNLDITYDYKPVDKTVRQKLYELHLPLNPDGTYGGTRNEELYGAITSGRGWWNHTNSNYYKINDFYNMGTEGSRILLKNYTVLQQTMSSTCGLCATNSVLTYYGDGGNQYDMELTLLDELETACNVTVKGRGTTVNELKKVLTQKGYSSTTYSTKKGSTPKFDTYEKYMQFIRENLAEGRPLVLPTYMGSGHFITIIGHDTMGTEYIYDDVIIVADSCDYWDGYQDGYNVYSAYKFFRQHTNQGYGTLQSFLVIKKKAS